MANLFERLNQGRPAPTEEAIKQWRGGAPPIEKLLDWLVNHWDKTTVTAREIRIYGPRSVRHGKTALNLTQTLTERGWLVPVKGNRRDKREWKIAGKLFGAPP